VRHLVEWIGIRQPIASTNAGISGYRFCVGGVLSRSVIVDEHMRFRWTIEIFVTTLWKQILGQLRSLFKQVASHNVSIEAKQRAIDIIHGPHTKRTKTEALLVRRLIALWVFNNGGLILRIASWIRCHRGFRAQSTRLLYASQICELLVPDYSLQQSLLLKFITLRSPFPNRVLERSMFHGLAMDDDDRQLERETILLEPFSDSKPSQKYFLCG
jgi:hypothetical protein